MDLTINQAAIVLEDVGNGFKIRVLTPELRHGEDVRVIDKLVCALGLKYLDDDFCMKLYDFFNACIEVSEQDTISQSKVDPVKVATYFLNEKEQILFEGKQLGTPEEFYKLMECSMTLIKDFETLEEENAALKKSNESLLRGCSNKKCEPDLNVKPPPFDVVTEGYDPKKLPNKTEIEKREDDVS